MISIKVKRLFYRIGINIKESLPITSNGNKYIIVTMDYFSKWLEAKVLSNIRVEIVVEFIYNDIICRHEVL